MHTVRSRLPRLHTRSAVGLAILIGILLPPKLWRAAQEHTIWTDEAYSLGVVHHDATDLIDRIALDAHPPGYFLALKTWLAAGARVGIETGILSARSFGVASWLGLALVAWVGGRRLLGPNGGALLAWAIAASAAMASFANMARGYAIASSALFVCFLSLVSAATRAREPGRGSELVPFLAYSAGAAVAMWVHNLSAIAIVLLGLTWLVLSVRKGLGSPFARHGAVAHLVALLLLTPWALRIPDQVRLFRQMQPPASPWQTEPTVQNLLLVPGYWFAFDGSGSSSPWSSSGPAVLLGIASGALPAVLAAGALLWGRVRSAGGAQMALGVVGLTVASAFTLATWGLARYDLVSAFHGPRYQLLVACIWAGGLVGLSLWATSRLGWRSVTPWIAMAPWLVCSVTAQWWMVRSDARSAGSGLAAGLREARLPLGERAYVTPEALIPFYHRTLAPYDVRPVQELVCASAIPENAFLLDLNGWERLRSNDDARLVHAVRSRLLSEDLTVTRIDQRNNPHTLYRLESLRSDTASALCHPERQQRRAAPSDAVSVAFAEDQRLAHGWSYLEFDADLTPRRWGVRRKARIVFDRPTTPGDYRLQIVGWRSPHPSASLNMTVEVEDELFRQEVETRSGGLHVDLTVRLENPHDPLTLRVGHELWSPKEHTGSTDRRKLSFVLYRAWVTRV